MRINWSEYRYQKKMIRGYVHDEKGNPVDGAVVILEKFKPVDRRKEFEWKGTFVGYQVTKRYGKYCFVVRDSTSYYKVKVFDKVCQYRSL